MSAEPFWIDILRCLELLENYQRCQRLAAAAQAQRDANRWDGKAQASWDMAINILKRLTGPNLAP